MSRIGKLPIEVPQGINITVEGHTVKIQGPRGTLEKTLPSVLAAELKDGQLLVSVKSQSKTARVLSGTFRSHLANMVDGISRGWSKQLELVGSGYRCEVKDDNLILTVGYSIPVVLNIPKGIEVKITKNVIDISGADKEAVGGFCANIRKVRPPEPYKGKGILYVGEIIRRKAGKAAASATTS